MDTLISSTLEEICRHGAAGVSVSSLWTALTPTLTPALKSTLWTSLLLIPSLQFTTSGRDSTPFSLNDTNIQRFEDAELIDLKIVAKEHLRDSFVGLYDCEPSTLVLAQRRALNKLAFARGDGVMQTELTKEIGGDAKTAFYHVRKLESRGLVVKQPAVLKTKESSDDGGVKNNSAVTTNLVYLSRYAKHLGVQQRFEVNKGDRTFEKYGVGEDIDINEDGLSGESLKDDVLIKDYLPAMKAVCDKLEGANDKVLVISDIKRDLGYSGNTGRHRAWRTILRRLKDAGLVEEFDAEVNKKVERCLRLLRKLMPKDIGAKNPGCEDVSGKNKLKFGRCFEQTEELVDLPIDHQIYDIIDAAGKDGATVGEACEKLGLDKKRTYSRIQSMIPRFGMHQRVEQFNTNKVFRIITHGNFSSEGLTTNLGIINTEFGESKTCNYSTSEIDFGTPEKPTNRETVRETVQASAEDGHATICYVSMSESQDKSSGMAVNSELALVSAETEKKAIEAETAPLTLSKPSSSGPVQMSPRPLLTADGALREQRILKRLEEDKFILRAELHRWLMSFEKSKKQTMDRKTTDRILNKLQQEGHCKCVNINVPLVTDCGRNRNTVVVLHPSVQTFPPELVGAIHDALRLFEKQIRGQVSSRSKVDESIPVLSGVMRMQPHVDLDEKVAKSEIMRANGFVLAKMVRTKLLHCFLWDYVRSLPEWGSIFLSGNLVHSPILFSPEAAMKAIPVELFLQVAGSTEKIDGLVEKCRKGLCLSDLSAEEYRCFVDTRATGRLSSLIDILRRLKLIRLVRDGHLEDMAKASHATLTHALELKPYIEEPLLVLSASNSISIDLRPTIRHDFVLSSREAVDEYWKTLEFCYAVADPKAALHAFPGSVVPEVFINRSWASVRVMSTIQRAELLKWVMADDIKRKLSFRDCEKIAKELNLTLQQVLRVYYDKHYRHLTRFQGFDNAGEYQPLKRGRFVSSKRKKGVLSTSRKHVRIDGLNEKSGDQGLIRIPDLEDQLLKEKELSSSKEHEMLAQENDCCSDNMEEAGPDGGGEYLSSPSALSMMDPTRRTRFLWTDELDRQLVIEYARHRALLGAKFHRVDWSSLPDLPAAPKNCARRMAFLNRNEGFRKALMRLCTVLSGRYGNHLKKTQNACLTDKVDEVLVRRSTKEALDGKYSNDVEEKWDNFDDENVRRAFDDVLRSKQIAKFETSKRVASTHEEWSNLNVDAENSLGFGLESSSCLDKGIQNSNQGNRKGPVRSSGYQRLYQKVIKLLNERSSLNRQVHKSLAVSNAVELLKLVFLSKKTAPQLPNLLAETLRRYSEHDLYAAFSYLRDKKIMVGGDAGEPYVLSQQFLRSISRSPFPPNTGKRAAKFSNWLHSREKDLIEAGTDLSAELQCGDVYYLFALVSSGELSISPSVPNEGVGEAEDNRSLKRKAEDDEFSIDNRAKIMKLLADSELVSRREKGFPGVTVSVRRETVPKVEAVEFFRNGDICTGEISWDNGLNSRAVWKFLSSSSSCTQREEIPDFDSIVPAAQCSGNSAWEAMVFYAEYLMQKLPVQMRGSCFTTDVFITACTAIKKAGDQGLSMEELSEVVGVRGENMCRLIVDVLQKFGRALKVNAYNSVHVVDTLYRSKYFVTPVAAYGQDIEPHAETQSLGQSDNNLIPQPENDATNETKELSVSDPNVHKITILNQPEDAILVDQSQCTGVDLCLLKDAPRLSLQSKMDRSRKLHVTELSMPILPWINGDGTVNKVVYNRLVRRIIGIIMQNPGILEHDIIQQIDAINPQSCRILLEQMILEKHVFVRNMYQSVSSGPPAFLQKLLGESKSKSVYRKHLYANPMSTFLL